MISVNSRQLDSRHQPPETQRDNRREPVFFGECDYRLSRDLIAQGCRPRQARRLVRWQVRREAMQKQGGPVFTSPMRPGRPPGYRKKPSHEVDEVLKECHWLARDAEQPDTS